MYSQFVAKDESQYKEDSFVVTSDEEVDTEDESSSGSMNTAISAKKRKMDKDPAQTKKWCRIIQPSSDSG